MKKGWQARQSGQQFSGKDASYTSDMPLYIRDAEVDRLARRLAELDKASKTEAIRNVLREAVALRERRGTAQERFLRGMHVVEKAGALLKATGTYKPYTKEEADGDFAYLDEDPIHGD